MKTSTSIFKNTKKIVLLAILAALGSILMFIEIPYPIAPFLRFDLSELVILLTVEIFGFWPSVLVAVIKSLMYVMVMGVTTPMGIGVITAFIASVIISGLYVLVKKGINGTTFSKKFLRFLLIIIGFSMILTICNYLFITPIYFGGLWFTDVKDWATLSSFIPGLPFDLGYGAAIAFIYIPFNSLKGLLVLTVYEIISPRLIETFKKLN